MKNYWFSFISGNYPDEGCLTPPFTIWVSEQLLRRSGYPKTFKDGNYKHDNIISGIMDCESEDKIWENVKKYFPDFKKRFCKELKLEM